MANLPLGDVGAARVLPYTGPGDATVTLVFLHDEESSVPQGLLAALQERGTVVAPVHPGFGEAPRPAWVKTVRDIADYELDVIDEAGAAPLVLVGSSFGGWVAAELALRLSHRVRAVLLLGPLGLHVQDELIADHWFRTPQQRARLLYEDPQKAPQVGIEESVANDESMARYGWNPRLVDPVLAPRLRRLSAPVRILWGEAERFVPASHAEAWLAALPDASSARVPGSGHFLAYEARESVLAELDDLIGRTATGA